MKKLYSPILLILFVACVNNLFSQNVSTFNPPINNIPSSPEAALLGRFGDIPVGYYTGTAEISVPLYTIKEAGVDIPIQLRYHSSGIKVADEATWVGLGWDLSPGGEIIQEVRGKRDDMDWFYGYGPGIPEGYDYLKNKILANGQAYLYKFMKHYCYGAAGVDVLEHVYEEPYASNYYFLKYYIEEGGAQPDIYHFNFGGHSGKFYVNFETNEIVQIDKSEEIIFVNNGNNSITARTSDGISYHFGVVEMAYNTDVLPDDIDKVGKTYKLSSITLLNGDTIDFSYIDTNSSNLTFQESYMIVENCSGDNQNVKGLENRIIKNDLKTLSSISTKDVVINFILEDREDIISYSTTTPNAKRLKAIEITSKGSINKKIKSFELGYSYFPYNDNIGVPIISTYLNDYFNTNKDRLGKRLKLDFVKEIGYDDNGIANRTKPPHSFEYDVSTIMPLKISFSKDFWGYYNGINNKSLLPDLEYFDYNNAKAYLQPKFIIGVGWLTYQLPFSYGYYTGVNRYTDNSKAGAYMLKKMKYPTGGFSEFEYEPNSFTNQFIPNSEQLNISNKLVTLQDQNYPNNTTTSSFELSKTTTITFVNSIYDGYISNMVSALSPQQMAGSYIQLRKVDMTGGSSSYTLIKRWDLSTVLNVDFETNHGKVWNEDVLVEFDPNPNIHYEVDISLPDNIVNNSYGSVYVKSRINYSDDAYSISNQCGMRIKSIKNYAQTGILTNNKTIKYYDGKLLNRFEPLSAKETFCHFGEGSYTNGIPNENVSVRNEISISSDNLVNREGILIGYGRVEEIAMDKNGDNIGKKQYIFHNTENINSKNLPIISTGLNGLLVDEKLFEKNNLNFLYQKTNSYQALNPEQYFYGTINVHRLSGRSSYCTGNSPGVTDYSFSTYPIISRFIKLKSSTIRNKFNGNDVTTTEDYTYNNKGSISTVTTKNSKNEILTKKYFYPGDPEMSSKPNAYSLNNLNRIDNPLVTQTFNGTEKLSEKETKYGLFDNKVLPQYVYAGKAATTTEKKITYNQYDDKGNLLQYTLENSTPVAIIWGYNQTLPIAKVENATYSQASTLYTADDATFRNRLPNAMITTYTYKPLIGVSTITDPKGDKITYTYDSFGNLLNVKDKDGNILSENEYHYKN